MKTREQIITSMCYTYRHDYGITKQEDPGGYNFPSLSGMTEVERKSLWNTMAQIFDNDIVPYMEFKRDEDTSRPPYWYQPWVAPNYDHCSKCGLKLNVAMGYICSQQQCPTGLGPVL